MQNLMEIRQKNMALFTLFDMGFFLTISYGGASWPPPHHNFVVFPLMIIKFGTDIKLDVFYTMVAKPFVT